MTATKEILWFSIVWWLTTAGLFWLAFPLVWRAFRTGRLLARGRIYDREDSPGLYWGGVVFWIVLCAFALGFSLYLL